MPNGGRLSIATENCQLAMESGAPVQASTETMLEPLHGAGAIMVVHDERFITESTGEWLTEPGGRCIAASGGQEALALHETHREAVDLVILDMDMPGMDGGETFERLRAVNPNVNVRLISGYGLEGRAARIRNQVCQGFL